MNIGVGMMNSILHSRVQMKENKPVPRLPR